MFFPDMFVLVVVTSVKLFELRGKHKSRLIGTCTSFNLECVLIQMFKHVHGVMYNLQGTLSVCVDWETSPPLLNRHATFQLIS